MSTCYINISDTHNRESAHLALQALLIGYGFCWHSLSDSFRGDLEHPRITPNPNMTEFSPLKVRANGHVEDGVEAIDRYMGEIVGMGGTGYSNGQYTPMYDWPSDIVDIVSWLREHGREQAIEEAISSDVTGNVEHDL